MLGRRLGSCIWLAALLAPAATAHAQPAPAADGGRPDPAADGGSAANELHAPELIERVAAEYPAEALAARVEGTVLLRLWIELDGHVSDVEVVTAAGNGFDEAAAAAARSFVFTPARRGDRPIRARIQYAYEFHLPPPPPPPPMAAAAPPAPAPPRAVVDVQVEGASAFDRRRRSAEAVTLIDTREAQRRSGNLGDVLVATQGVNLRRDGGLGSFTRFSLNGMVGDQVRLFIDGLPLELTGYPFGIANIPVNLISGVEIYAGVVPIRFGADALGGAVNLMTKPDVRETHASGSYEIGSFETQRVTLSAQHYLDSIGLFARASGFIDYARNDYPIDVDVPDDKGRPVPARVDRFHDAYRAQGANFETGFVDRSWAERLVLQGFVTNYLKDYNNNVVMSVPYGGVSYGELSGGGHIQYKQPLGHGVTIDVIAGYAHTRGHFQDKATCVYDWYGRCVRPRTTPGESDSKPHDELNWDNTGYGRVNVQWRAARQHTFRLSLAPSYLSRTGDERLQGDPRARDPLNAERTLLTDVNGLEYQLDLWGGALENVAFAKQYVQRLWSEEPRPGNVFRRRDRDNMRFGFGDSLRYTLVRWLYVKGSYEFATRLPTPREVFGDNAFVVANLELLPELSHNFNVGVTLDARDTDAGSFRSTINGFARMVERLIVPLGNERTQSYQNVYDAHSTGVEASAGWTSPREYLVLDTNLTWMDFRNDSKTGTFADFDRDRIPNTPYFFVNGSAQLQFHDVVVPRDRIALFWTTRYVHSFFRGWESVGLREYKQVVPAQVVHTIGVGYMAHGGSGTITTTVEVQNLADEPVYDYFGVQRPGRAFFLKTTAEL
jgi:TonB family protein